MSKKDLAKAIMSGTQGKTDPGDAVTGFWKAVRDYIEENGEVEYSWTGLNPAGAPDPTVKFIGKIKTSGDMSPSGESGSADSAMSKVSATMNSNAATWTVEPPADFKISPILIIPGITLTPSGSDNRDSAIETLAGQILDGLKLATPVSAGQHQAYMGTASFIRIF